MQIVELFEKVIKDSNYAGEFNFGDLMLLTNDKQYHALATQGKGNSTCILIFVNGEGEGAIQIDEYGMMYGDKVLYNIDKKGDFKLFLVTKSMAESLASRCRIYEKSHLMDKSKTLNLPEISKFSLQPAKVTIQLTHDGQPAEGLKVKLMKVGESGVFDTTSREGRVSFVLQKGRYDCIITGTDQREYKYKITLPGKEVVVNLEI